jgi:putative ABC transport system permease protein
MSMSDFTIITRSLTTRMFSTVTTVLTVAVAVALMLMLLSMRHAGEQAFERGAGNIHILVSADDSALVSVLNNVFYAGVPRRALTWQKYEEIARSFPWAYAIPTQLGDSYRGFPVMATVREFFPPHDGEGRNWLAFEPIQDQPWQLVEGRFFERSWEVVLGADVAQATGLRLGERIHLTHGIDRSRQARFLRGDDDSASPHVHYEYDYEVVGILERTGSPHDRTLFTNLESTWIIHAPDPFAVTDVTELNREITGIFLRVPTREGRQVGAALQQQFNRLRADPSITIASPSDEVRKLFNIVSNIDQIFLAMAFLVMISSGIAIMLALYNSMEQRRRQIAVLRVLGCGRWRIFGFVVTESATLGLLGALVGIMLSWVGLRVVAEIMQVRLGLVISPNLEPVSTFLLVMGTILLAATAGIIPASLGYRTSVVRNLRPIG